MSERRRDGRWPCVFARTAPPVRPSVPHREDGRIHLLAVGQRAVRQRMLLHDLRDRILDSFLSIATLLKIIFSTI